MNELSHTKDAKRRQSLLDAVTGNKISILDQGNEEIDRLAEVYVQHGVIPPGKIEDALHLAYSTFYEMDVLVTWNYRHLARARTAMAIQGINLSEGYSKPLQLLTPFELLEP